MVIIIVNKFSMNFLNDLALKLLG